MNILVINGPNLNLLGIREPGTYGTNTLEEMMSWLRTCPEAGGHSLKFTQSNHEGDIIDTIHQERNWCDGMVINPGALTHYSYAIRDAISAVGIPTVEVHLTNLQDREDFRKTSVILPVCLDQITGLGKRSYLEGLRKLLHHIEPGKEEAG